MERATLWSSWDANQRLLESARQTLLKDLLDATAKEAASQGPAIDSLWHRAELLFPCAHRSGASTFHSLTCADSSLLADLARFPRVFSACHQDWSWLPASEILFGRRIAIASLAYGLLKLCNDGRCALKEAVEALRALTYDGRGIPVLALAEN